VLNVLATYPNKTSRINVESDVSLGDLKKPSRKP